MQKKRKICFVLTTSIHYTRNFYILKELQKRRDVDLHIVLGGEIILPRATSKFSNISDLLKKEKFKNVYESHFYLDGDKVIDKAKTLGLGIIELSALFDMIKPDLVVVRGDRFEVQAAAAASVYQNIPCAHIEGGDITGSVDETVRHTVTKLCQIHFATNEPAKKRLLRMGEHPNYVFNYGSPEIEALAKYLQKKPDLSVLQKSGSGKNIDLKNYMIVMFHPVTSQLGSLSQQVRDLYQAVNSINMSVIWFYPNFDAGSESIAHELRKISGDNPESKIHFSRYVTPEIFAWLLNHTKCFVGNSSAGLKECSYLGVPVVNVGDRQNGRLSTPNVLNSSFKPADLAKKIRIQLQKIRYPQNKIYHKPNTAKKIADKLATSKLYIQKKFIE